MRYHALGAAGLVVSEIGFGCWGIGGLSPGATSYGATDDATSRRALERALEAGITLYDTADVYGHGHSESLLGEVFHGRRQRVVIASKVGFAGYGRPPDFSAASIVTALESSLRRLRTDWLDLYQLHSPDMALVRARPEIVDTLRRAQREGKIRAFGVSLRSPADALAAVELGFACVQINFNLIDQRPIEQGVLELCRRRGVGLIARTPLCFGFLTGHFGPDAVFGPSDHRSGWPREQIALWATAWQRFRAVLPASSGQTPAQLALRYCLSYPAVAGTIPGMLTPKEVDDNLAASALGPLSADERRRAEDIYREHDFFVARSAR